MMHNFTYLGEPYSMNDDELHAAYFYMQHQFRLNDAKYQFQDLFDENINRLKEEFNILYEDAISDDMLEEYVRRFENRHDCDIDDNAQWVAAIEAVLEDKVEGLL